MKFLRRALTALASLALVSSVGVFAVGCGGDAGDAGGIRSAAFGEVELEPSSFRFPKISVGDSAERTVVIRNVGSGDLKLARIRAEFSAEYSLYWYEGTVEGTDQLVGVENGINSLPQVITIAPENAITLILQYAPATDEAPTGRLAMETNSASQNLRDLVIPIRGARVDAEIVVAPNFVDFGRVSIGETIEREVVISNIGQVAATITAMEINESANYTMLIPDWSPRTMDGSPSAPVAITPGDPQWLAALADPDGDGQPGLAPQASFTLVVTFTAQFERGDNGELSITSNSVIPNVLVDLTANGSAPCIQVVPSELVFGAGLIDRENESLLTIESCGAEALQIDSITVTAGGEHFEIPAEAIEGRLPGRLAAADLAMNPPVRPTWNVPVLFTPAAEQPYTGTIVVTSNDPNRPSIEVPMRGRGSINECPVAAVAEDELIVRPLDVIQLDGSRSTDTDGPNGQPVQYEWVVTQRPEGSTSVPVERFSNRLSPAEGGPADNASTPTAVFFVDLAGTYVIELRVTDSEMVSAPSASCPQAPAQVTIIANPNEDIHLQVTWNTPGDPDQTDLEGSDVDIHFLHPNGLDWFRGGGTYDCYFANPTPDWGRANNPDDNPSLDIDDTNGSGPENINLDQPENTDTLGAPYRVGVHYYRSTVGAFGGADAWGPSDVRVRIYLGGVIAYDVTRRLQETNDFWEVAAILWTGAGDHRAVEINQLSVREP
jgi:hypothetical protein